MIYAPMRAKLAPEKRLSTVRAKRALLPRGAGSVPAVQAKLTVRSPADPLEREADAIAARVVRGGTAAGDLTLSRTPALILRACAACEAEDEQLQRKSAGQEPSEPVVDGVMQRAIDAERASGGSPLPGDVRSFMELRFGRPFSHVRVHHDAKAAGMAARIDAQAFTVGQDIFFGRGGYQPRVAHGKLLLAHELVHTLQQRAHGHEAPLLRKKGKPERRDVIITTSSDLEAKEPALLPGATVYRVGNLAELKDTLAKIDFPIGTLLFNSHGTNGSIKVGSEWKDAAALGAEISKLLPKDSAPRTVDLRACNLGQDPGGMDAIREALGAGKILGGTCFLVGIPKTPMEFEQIDAEGESLGFLEITSKTQLKKDPSLRRDFDDNFETHLNSIQGPPGKTLPCIVNGDGTIEGAKEAYFKGRGHLMMAYYTPNPSGEWDPLRSTCLGTAPTRNLTSPLGGQIFNFNSEPCQIITISGGKKTKK